MCVYKVGEGVPFPRTKSNYISSIRLFSSSLQHLKARRNEIWEAIHGTNGAGMARSIHEL
jgi:hypothetical protein